MLGFQKMDTREPDFNAKAPRTEKGAKGFYGTEWGPERLHRGAQMTECEAAEGVSRNPRTQHSFFVLLPFVDVLSAREPQTRQGESSHSSVTRLWRLLLHMKKLIASLLAFAGVTVSAQPLQSPQKIDPKTILFSVPTLSDDIAALEQMDRALNGTDLAFHEDDWSQVEFLPKSLLPEIQRMLKEYKAFEQANRVQSGWRKVYVRKIERKPLISGAQSIQQLEKILGAKPGGALVLFSTGTAGGRVKDGFTLPLGGNVTLYGYTTSEGIPVLGASVGQNPDDSKLVQAFTKLNSASGLVLVDWRTQMVLVSTNASGQIDVWRP